MSVSMTAHVKPASDGLRVPFPGTRNALPPEGAVVELTSYWRERIRDGSVVEVEAKVEAEAADAPRRSKPKKD